MATNPQAGDGHRNGAVRDRSQFKTPADNWAKRAPRRPNHGGEND